MVRFTILRCGTHRKDESDGPELFSTTKKTHHRSTHYFCQLFKFLYNIIKSQPFILSQNQQSQTILTSFLQIIPNHFQTLFSIPKNEM